MGPGVRSAAGTDPLGDRYVRAGRRSELLWFAVIGTVWIVAGGLVAAVTAPTPTEHGTWAAGYLVLVCGVAQVCLGLGQSLSTGDTPGPVVAVQLIGWNLGNAVVLAGTLTGRLALVDVGAALLVVTLVLLARSLVPGRARHTAGRRWLRYGYALLIFTLLLSIPVGLVLARVQA
jgi:hypothetical protein